MNTPLRFAVIGLGGYAAAHLHALTALAHEGRATLAAVVALEKDRRLFPRRVRALHERGVRLFRNLDEFFAHGTGCAEVLTVPIGIHAHARVSLAAMQAGLHVYCEKPIAATLQEVDALIATREATQRRLAVGFQYIYSHAIQQLKARLVAGKLGRVRTAALLGASPRSEQYYRRNEWAGKLRCAEQWVLDSPANNAHAHELLNLLYLAAPRAHSATVPKTMHAELYRANPIESCDTLHLRFHTREDVACQVLLTHASRKAFGPILKLDCEKGQIEWRAAKGVAEIVYHNGAREQFENTTFLDGPYHGMRDLIYALHNGYAPLCSLEIARCHTQTIQAMHASCPEILTIPSRYITRHKTWNGIVTPRRVTQHWVRGLDEMMPRVFAAGKFLCEVGWPWRET